VKVLDFGISKASEAAGTDTTAAVGSPLWMAPEQAQRGRLTPATDVFPLALLTFRLLSGRSYWRSAQSKRPTLKETLIELLMKPYPPASARSAELGGASLPPGFDAWFDRAAQRDPAGRFPDAGAAWEALAPVLAAAIALEQTAEGPGVAAPDEDALATRPFDPPAAPPPPAQAPASAQAPSPARLPEVAPRPEMAPAPPTARPPPRPLSPHAIAITAAVVLVLAGLALLARYSR